MESGSKLPVNRTSEGSLHPLPGRPATFCSKQTLLPINLRESSQPLSKNHAQHDQLLLEIEYNVECVDPHSYAKRAVPILSEKRSVNRRKSQGKAPPMLR